jgi:hypothetical protein
MGEFLMTVMTLSSEEARRQWREMLDSILAGKTELVVERYGKPIAAVVNFDLWQAMKKRWIGELDRISAEMDAGHYLTHEQVIAGLQERGLLDDAVDATV